MDSFTLQNNIFFKHFINFTYSFDGQYKTSISEENEEDGNEEVDNKHVDDIWLIVEAWSQSVVVGSTGALHALRKVPVWGLRRDWLRLCIYRINQAHDEPEDCK